MFTLFIVILVVDVGALSPSLLSLSCVWLLALMLIANGVVIDVGLDVVVIVVVAVDC